MTSHEERADHRAAELVDMVCRATETGDAGDIIEELEAASAIATALAEEEEPSKKAVGVLSFLVSDLATILCVLIAQEYGYEPEPEDEEEYP